jgi:hypothetical protein
VNHLNDAAHVLKQCAVASVQLAISLIEQLPVAGHWLGRDRTNKKSGPPAQGRRGFAMVKNRIVDRSVLHLLGAAARCPLSDEDLAAIAAVHG